MAAIFSAPLCWRYAPSVCFFSDRSDELIIPSVILLHVELRIPLVPCLSILVLVSMNMLALMLGPSKLVLHDLQGSTEDQ